ncbi:MAG TPA: hypothetical protein VFO03_00810 [Gaiellaceae bacterium]|nr:hypothetical protein [Gaiellaceae bacterium]
MTNHVARLYATAAALVALFLAWAGIAARPWGAQPPDPRVAALNRREQRLQSDAWLVRQVVHRRWATYRAALAESRRAAAAPPPAPSVRIVTLPPVTTSRSS